MGKYIGSNSPYGLYEKQVLELTAGKTKFALDYKIGYETSILVVYEIAGGSKILEAGVDYSLVDGGTSIQLAFEPFDNDATYAERLFVLYLGKQLSIPVPLEKKPLLVQITGATTNTLFITNDIYLSKDGVIVSKNGTQLSYGTQFTISSDGTSVVLTDIATAQDSFDVYIFAGIQRLTQHIIDNDTITSEKLKQRSVTTSKLDLTYTPFNTNSFLVTGSGSMSALSTHVIETLHMVQGNAASVYGAPVKVRVKFVTTLAGSADNRIRFTLPDNLPTTSTVISGSVVIRTDTTIESGILTWGATNAVDVYRQFGVNYPLGTHTIEASFEYVAKT